VRLVVVFSRLFPVHVVCWVFCPLISIALIFTQDDGTFIISVFSILVLFCWFAVHVANVANGADTIRNLEVGNRRVSALTVSAS